MPLIMNIHRLVFGPVPSRRLGLSLGVDPIPPKTCTMNCVYCECGKTNRLTSTREMFYPPQQIIDDIETALREGPRPDYITFAGSGEPTLYLGLGEVVAYLKKNHSEFKLALITNSTLLDDPQVIQETLGFDVVLPSLDAATQSTFLRVTRPVRGITADHMIEALANYRCLFLGPIWLEIFIVPGLNDGQEELQAFLSALKKINPHRIQVNSLDRPGTEKWVQVPPRKELFEIKKLFASTGIPVDVVCRGGDFESHGPLLAPDKVKMLLEEWLKRRPATMGDLKRVTGYSEEELQVILKEWQKEKQVEIRQDSNNLFYCWRS
ncbi:MAG: radical SAM protein [Pseudomonadota bacterium]